MASDRRRERNKARIYDYVGTLGVLENAARAGKSYWVSSEMSDSRFSPRAMKFLELYFGGALMKDAARAAGYKGASDQALCNSARRILSKFSKTPWATFRRTEARERKIAQLLTDFDGRSELQQLKALKILSRCLGD